MTTEQSVLTAIRASERAIDVARINAALKAAGMDYRVDSDGTFDVTAFTRASIKRWPHVTAKLAQ